MLNYLLVPFEGVGVDGVGWDGAGAGAGCCSMEGVLLGTYPLVPVSCPGGGVIVFVGCSLIFRVFKVIKQIMHIIPPDNEMMDVMLNHFTFAHLFKAFLLLNLF